MLLREINAVYSESHMKPINTLYGKTRSYWMLKLVVNVDSKVHCALKSPIICYSYCESVRMRCVLEVCSDLSETGKPQTICAQVL
jgi:hypothetical protein